MTTTRAFGIGAFFLAALFTAAPTRAQAAQALAPAATAQPQALPARSRQAVHVFQVSQTLLFLLIAQPQTTKRDADIKAMFDMMLDYDRLARDSLGQHWGKLTRTQRAQFSDLLEQLVRDAYQRQLKKILGYHLVYTGTATQARTTIVRTEAFSTTNPYAIPFRIDFVLQRMRGRWLVVDIVPEGASLVSVYREQFSRIIKKRGFAELVRLVKRKIRRARP